MSTTFLDAEKNCNRFCPKCDYAWFGCHVADGHYYDCPNCGSEADSYGIPASFVVPEHMSAAHSHGSDRHKQYEDSGRAYKDMKKYEEQGMNVLTGHDADVAIDEMLSDPTL